MKITREDIRKGESKTLEFKVQLPENSETWVKTIIAFANSSGGNLVIGVDAASLEVVGVDRNALFHTMDKITNVIMDSCEPQIMPEISFQDFDGKTVIIVSVAPESNRPYYLKQKGRNGGTYIRVSGTARLADDMKVRELEMQGRGVSWDSLVCIDYPLRHDVIERLCQDIARYRNENGIGKKNELVMEQQLVNWGVLVKQGEEIKATNAFALLAGDHFSFAKIQCALFKGKTRSMFLDKQEIAGPIYSQIERAIQFVLRNTRTNVEIKSVVRKESPELPESCLREMITNAVCHRDYLDRSCVQVSVFEDRVEVASPGGLYGGLTLEDALQGRSALRNKSIAEVFSQMGFVERWGTGLQRIMEDARGYGLVREPSFSVTDSTFRIQLFRNSPTGEKSEIEERNSEIEAHEPEIVIKMSEIDQNKSEIQEGNSEIDKPAVIHNIELQISESPYKTDTKARILKVYQALHDASFFGSSEIMDTLQVVPSSAALMMKRLVELGVVEKVTGKGKAKYRFKSS